MYCPSPPREGSHHEPDMAPTKPCAAAGSAVSSRRAAATRSLIGERLPEPAFRAAKPCLGRRNPCFVGFGSISPRPHVTVRSLEPGEKDMQRLLIQWVLTALAAVLLALPALAAPIVPVEWLQKNLGREDILLIDA